MKTRNKANTAPTIPISKLLKNPEKYKHTITKGKTTAQQNLKKLPGRIFNDYPALVDEKKFDGFIKNATELMNIPQRLFNIVAGAEEPENNELKDIKKTKICVRDFYFQIIWESCHALLNPKKREIDSNITKELISDEKYVKVHPISTIVSMTENIIRSIIVEIDNQFIDKFCNQWDRVDVLRYQAILGACQTYRATHSVEAFKELKPAFTLEDYNQKEIYLHTHFGEKFIKSYDEQFETHNLRMAKLNLLVARFQKNWANDTNYFATFCKNVIDQFYSTEVLNSFLKQLTNRKFKIKEYLHNHKNKIHEFAQKFKNHELTIIDSAVELVTKFKVGEIDVLDLAKSMSVLISDMTYYQKPLRLFCNPNPHLTLPILNELQSSIKLRLSRDELIKLNEFMREAKKQKTTMSF